MKRVVVIGAGVAGITAALRLRKYGVNVTLVAKGLGGLQLSQGTVDVLGYTPERVSDPLAAVGELAAAGGDGLAHPYARIGATAVADGVEFLAEQLGEGLLVGDIHRTINLPTAVGSIRPTCLVQPSMLAGECRDGAQFAIVGFRQLKDFTPKLVAENLSRTVLPDGGRLTARPLTVDLTARAPEVDSTGLTFARAFDDPGFRAEFAAMLIPLLQPGETVGLPAVLGWKDPTAWLDLAEQLGHPIFEIPLQPPAVPGIRLNEALIAAGKSAGVRFVQGSKAIAPVIEDGRLVAVKVATSGTPRDYAADAFILATGGFESGALTLDSHQVLHETTLGLPVTAPPGQLIHGDYWSAPQPLFAAGLAVDDQLRPVDADGSVIHPNLHAVGGILAGAYRWTEKSGEGIAVGSAVKAADIIGKELV